jgi:hypothetical protein
VSAIPRRTAIAIALVAAFALAACGANVDPAASAAPAPAAVTHAPSDHAAPAAHRIDQDVFRQEMRKLWEDHVTWTRLFIVSAVADLPDTGPTAERLLQNQADIGNAIKPFYGAAAGDQLTSLLRDHILIAADLIAAAKAGDDAGVARESARWDANARQIARFLHRANPRHWPRRVLLAMLRQHLRLTTLEVVARLQGDWEADVAAYDRIHRHALMMADALSTGIVAQLPGRFR